MIKVITYGTFDLFHEGHYNLLKRAKALGNYLIVGVTTENYDKSRGKLNVQESLMQRIKNVKESGLADEIIIEEYEGQKVEDIQKYKVNKFAIGSDWKCKFDYLKEFCDVIYLERTKGISSTELREKKNEVIKVGIIGYGRIANRFIAESKYVSGVNVEGVYGLNKEKLNEFMKKNELSFFETDYEKFLKKIDAVYVASPHLTHYEYIKNALLNKKHVLSEKPIVLTSKQAEELYRLAQEQKVILLEGIKTAFSPGFQRLISLSKSGVIGEIKDIDASFTKLVDGDLRELDSKQAGGSITELGSYPFLAIVKLLGVEFSNLECYSYYDRKKNIDLYTKAFLRFDRAIATAKVGLGVKSEGELIISGTKGYIYVPAPWWKTEYFEVRYEDSRNNKKYFYKFEGDGLRYELCEFINMINSKQGISYKLTPKESIGIVRLIENCREKTNQNIFY
ncbi:Gfo/Idh/MocA family oxidoreductase [Clostridium paraputrificum]|uniref:Gfo/Idh/MocA family oxidoreductase n=1 Tax=Clostridium paraputrificum TaxID=29363 RepID=UPI00232FD40C|nr:Gfo/Idh/MocA family oxidoreductase [Clostridium paraputrificum]MDB2106222.1 Gfo/Idh/MocA family oxidoreductase [Clostridium paraputrificum]MDB2112913.1 Gfo/Idh/MocA family oxidoreductase [Clostridium paraputrificum]